MGNLLARLEVTSSGAASSVQYHEPPGHFVRMSISVGPVIGP